MKSIYFARSIRGEHKPGETFFFQAAIDAIKAAGYTPAHETESKSRLLNHVDHDRTIYDRDIEWINKSRGVVAEVSNPSLGVGYEIAYAKHVCKIPVFACAMKDDTVSAMITGNLDVYYYRDTSDLAAGIESFLMDLDQQYIQTNPEYRVLGVQNCARCGKNHERLEYRHFDRPIEDEDGTAWDWWATCPVSGDPVLMHNLPIQS